MLNCPMGARKGLSSDAAAKDEERMRELVRFTERTFKTARPVPFGAVIFHTKSGSI